LCSALDDGIEITADGGGAACVHLEAGKDLRDLARDFEAFVK